MIAILNGKGGFSERWVEYCSKKGIKYKIADAYDSEVIEKIKDCDIVLWHYHHNNYKDALFAKQLLYALECAGKKIFPDWRTSWHFDDKVGQKYLLEAVGAPLVHSYVFYSKEDALSWAGETSFPKVFKLRGGAGAQNVRLVKNEREAIKLIKTAFGRGFPYVSIKQTYKETKRLLKEKRVSLFYFIKVIVAGILKPLYVAPTFSRQRGYIYFQDFIPNNNYDIRVVIVGDKAFGIKRGVRKNDFRASGSGNIIYKKAELNDDCVKIAFDVTHKLKAQCLGYDFVFHNGVPEIVEISYGFTPKGYDACEGYWTEDMVWHEGHFNPQEWMIDCLLGD